MTIDVLFSICVWLPAMWGTSKKNACSLDEREECSSRGTWVILTLLTFLLNQHCEPDNPCPERSLTQDAQWAGLRAVTVPV